MPLTPRRLSTLLLILTVFIWASSYIITKRVLQEAGPFTVTVLRFCIALATLIIPARRQGLRLRMLFRPDMVRYGLTGIALFFGLQNLGLTLTSAGSAALINAALPAATAVLSFYILREQLPPLRIAGIALSVSGVLLVGGVQPAAAGPWALAGNALVAGSMLAWAIYTIQGKRLPAEYPPLVATTAGMGAGLLMLLPLAAVELWTGGLPTFSSPGLLALLYLGCCSSALTLFLWNYAIRHVDAAAAGLFPNLIPPVGLLLAWAGGEPVGQVQLAGGALAMTGVWLSERQAHVRPTTGR